MRYVHYTKHCLERTLHRSMYKWEVPAMTDLRDWLKAHNIKNTLGGEMSYNTIQRMLSNRRYIGELRLRDVVQPNAIPALVSGELFGARPLHLAAQDRSVA